MKRLATLVFATVLSCSSFAADTTPMSPEVVDTEMQTAKAQIAKKRLERRRRDPGGLHQSTAQER